MRQLAGVIVKDLPRYVAALSRSRGAAWLQVHNRHEKLEPAPQGEGVRCLWRWTSELHAPRHMPGLGRWLLRRSLENHPILRSQAAPAAAEPQVTFIIGHRGEQRYPHLLATLESIAAQQSVPVECIVVQQEGEPTLANRLPGWVRYVHTPWDPVAPYCRSATFNAGAAHARSPVLILHDNDMLVPVDYAEQVLDRTSLGYDVVNLKRFVFYLDAAQTRAYMENESRLASQDPVTIVQNLEGGGSVAITRKGFETIGGMDESFIGWGGEDNDFWERASTLKVWPWANLPIVHLWHESQPGKQSDSPAIQLYEQRAALGPRERIERLRSARGH